MKSIFNTPILRVGILLVIATWLAAIWWSGESINTNTLESLYTGVALAAAIAVFAHEREALADAKQDQAELIQEMRVASRVHAISTKINRIEMRKQRLGTGPDGMLKIQLFGENSKELEAELDKVIGLNPEK